MMSCCFWLHPVDFYCVFCIFFNDLTDFKFLCTLNLNSSYFPRQYAPFKSIGMPVESEKTQGISDNEFHP